MTHSRKSKAATYNRDTPRNGPGIYTLDDIKQRCYIDESQHWNWRGQTIGGAPGVNIPPGVFGNERHISTTVRRATYVMTHGALPAGWVVWSTCGHDTCGNPAHLRAGTKAQHGKWLKAQGHMRGDPLRTARNRKLIAEHHTLSPERVAELEAVIAASEGLSQRDIAVANGCSQHTVAKIIHRRHPHQRPMVFGGYSVFSIGAAA